ncbi:MAG: hypothetical protein P4L42_01255 [Desulfocapsaceae bacterium]|nr:hypothetical protein [Desulfocapsaceae bacterium]
MKKMNMLQRGFLQYFFAFFAYLLCMTGNTYIISILIKAVYIAKADRQLASNGITNDVFLQVVQFVKNTDLSDAVIIIFVMGILVAITHKIMLKVANFDFVQHVILPRAVEFSNALRKIGVLRPADQMQFVKKYKLPVFIATTEILGDEIQNIKAKLYPFSRGNLTSSSVYSQNIGKRTLCLNADDYQHVIEEQFQQSCLADKTQLEAKNQEVVALTCALKTEMEKNDALQRENNELKVQMKTFGARVGKAVVTVREAFVVARVALPLIERLKQRATANKYTRPDIQSAFLAEVERQPDMKGTLQEIFDSKELTLPEAFMKAIRSELPGLVSTGGRSPQKSI